MKSEFRMTLIQGGGDSFCEALRNTNNTFEVSGTIVFSSKSSVDASGLNLDGIQTRMGSFHGECRVGSDVFNENSPVIDIIGQKFSKVVEIAKYLCEKFDQDCVLAKDCKNGQVYLIEQEKGTEMKPYKVTYQVTGTVTLSVLAASPEAALDEVEKEYPESDINWNHMLRVIDMQVLAVEDADGNVTEI